MSKFRIPLIKPTVGEEELEAVERVFESGMLTQGNETREFEKEFADFLGVKHAIAVSSGTTALHLSLVCVGVKNGDEVIVPDFTFPATGNVVFHCSASPVLVDIRLREFQIDPDRIEKFITKKTKVIMPVSEFGLTADMKPITELAEKYDLYVIEDSAPAIGSKRWGQYAGTFGSMNCFSFHPRKLVGIGEGGMVVTNDDRLVNLARSLKDHGRSYDKWHHVYTGYNYRLSDVQSAIGRVQLRKVRRTIEQRRKLAEYYDSLLRDYDDYILIPHVPSHCFHTYQSYVVLIQNSINGFNATTVKTKLRKKGIEVQTGTNCLSILPPFFRCRKDRCHYSYVAWQRSLALPLYEGMTSQEQDEVVTSLFEEIKKIHG